MIPLFAALLLAGGHALAPASDTWPAFRGDGSGHTAAKNLPVTWSPKENIAWTAKLPGYGQSSPVVWKGVTYVTAVEGENKEKCIVAAYDTAKGQPLWTKAFVAAQPSKSGPMVSRAAPTPAINEHGVFAFFDTGNLLHLTPKGDVVWERSLPKEIGEFKNNHGLASSPVLVGETLVVLVDHQGPSYLLGVDVKTGKDRWKKDRPSAGSWTSPIALKQGERPVVIISSSGTVTAYDGKTGDLLWTMDGIVGNNMPSAAVAGKQRFLVGASEAKGNADPATVAKSNCLIELGETAGKPSLNVVWTGQKVASSTASPTAAGEQAYFVDRGGVVTCVSMKNGQMLYKDRLDGTCWASPIVAGELIYFFGKDGNTTVIKTGPTFQKVASNTLFGPAEAPKDGGEKGGFYPDDSTVYGVAAIDGAFFVRTGTQLICIRSK